MLFGFLLSSAAAAPGFSDWLVTADFPAKPKIVEHPTAPQVRYIAEANAAKDGEHFGMTRLVPLPKGAPDGLDHLYQTLKSAMLKAKPSKLVEEERIKIGGLPAFRYVLDYEGTGRRVEYREVLMKSDLGYECYTIMCDYSATGPSEAVKRFFDSVKVSSEK